MKRRRILVVAGLTLAAFVLGFEAGSRFGQRPVVYRDIPVTPPPTREPDPVETSSDSGNPPPCVDTRNAGGLMGKNACVSGVVMRVYAARSGNTFLDFCQDYRTCPFTSVIFATDKDKFGNLEALQGKRVEIRGNVVNYQGHAEIIVHDPQQIRGAP